MIEDGRDFRETSPLSDPFVVMCRGHSGSRFLVEVLVRSGIWMGEGLNESSDWVSFLTDVVVPTVNSADYPLGTAIDSYSCGGYLRMLDEALAGFLKSHPGGPWGWKLPESVFVVPLIRHRYPRAKFIHLIRDGRDVILSDDGHFGIPFRYGGPLGFPLFSLLRSGSTNEFLHRLWLYSNRNRFDDFLLKTIFDTAQQRWWNGVELTHKSVEQVKYQLGILSWINHIECARRYGQEMGKDYYYELRYEDLCLEPIHTLERLFSWMGVKMNDASSTYALKRVRNGRIGKWRNVKLAPRSCQDYDAAIEIGRPLLTQLGYA